MKLNSKLTWGLAWAGLAVVLAVPSADFLTGQFGGKGSTALVTSTTDPATTGSTAPGVQRTASVTTRVTKTGVTIVPAGSPVPDPVDKLVESGKPVPDYISDGDTATTPVIPVARSDEPTQVATIEPTAPVAAPIPFPSRPPDIVRRAQPPVIVNEAALAPLGDQFPDQLDVKEPDGPVPPAGIQNDWQKARDRQLARYLEQNSLIDDGSSDGRSSASITVLEPPSSDYDPDGFYLSDGPNNSRAARRARIQQMLDDSNGDVSWF